MEISEYSLTVERDTSSVKEWFDSTASLKIYPNLPSKIAMNFRKKHVKGWIVPGKCNYYIGIGVNNKLIGVLGFLNPDFGNYDLLLKADTTPPEYKRSTELLLYVLKTKEVKLLLENYFNRDINTCYSKCFSNHEVISRYRKFGELVVKTPIRKADAEDETCYKIVGYDLGYLFKLGEYTLKEAKARFINSYEKNRNNI